ncbi:MAG: hypothetical protein E6Q97_25185 [Desulfurellales bacterium]|nr:MAG: hypothetical protein E6Q97_25185 [Desulfurellales bacterium]
MEQDHVAAALANPQHVTNWWPIALLTLMWIFREVVSFMKNGKEAPKNAAIDNQVTLLSKQKDVLDGMSEVIGKMAIDIAIIKDRLD